MLHFWVLVYIAALYVRPGEIVPSLAEVPIIQYLSAISGVAALVSLLLEPRKFWDQPHDKAMLLYWVAITISNPAWGYLAGGPAAFTDFFPVIFCYFLIRLGVRTFRQLQRATRVFVLLNLFLATNGLMQVFYGAGFGQVEAMDTKEGIRIMGTGIFNDPNDLGMTLVMSVPFVLSVVLGRKVPFFRRLFNILAFATLVAACYYTNSRGTILGLATVLGVFFTRRYGAVAGSVFATIGLVGLLAFGPSRMSQVSADEDSAQGRIQAWSSGIQMFKERPFTGVGYRRFGDVNGLVAHNAFVHVLGELGFFGAYAAVAIFYWYFQRLRAPADPDDISHRVMWQDLRASGIGLLLCISFLSRQYVVVPFILVAFGAAYAGSIQIVPSESDEDVLSNLVRIGVITVGLIVMFYVIVRLFANF